MSEQERPDFITEEHLLFLDNLRESGVTNMFAAAPYIEQDDPGLTRAEACQVLTYWMETFSERHGGEDG